MIIKVPLPIENQKKFKGFYTVVGVSGGIIDWVQHNHNLQALIDIATNRALQYGFDPGQDDLRIFDTEGVQTWSYEEENPD